MDFEKISEKMRDQNLKILFLDIYSTESQKILG